MRPSSSDGGPSAPRAARTWRATISALLLTAAAAAQQPAAPPIVDFRAPDGTRFVLVQNADLRQVHWAVASWVDGRDDPRGLEGLALATMRASLGGTWQIGSRDEGAERAAAQRVDEARRALRKARDDDALQQQVRAAEQELAALGDLRTFRRVLAAAPTYRPQIFEQGPTATLVLTTVADAIPDVAQLLLARREDQALRGLPSIWRELLATRIADRKRDRAAPLQAELLALLMPTVDHARMLDWPRETAFPTHVQALECWQASQHPRSTVHVLLGDFDAEAARAAIDATFAATSFPAPAERVAANARAPRTERRSVVHGYSQPWLAIAWTLPARTEPFVPGLVARWFADGDQSWLGRRLRSAGFRDLELRCAAPWPPVESGHSLLLLMIRDGSGKPDLLDEVLRQCAAVVKQKHGDGTFYPANMELQHEWNAQHDDPRADAASIARRALLYPRERPSLEAPPRVLAAPAVAMLKATLGSNPAIVEGRR